jgi:hypothetical protein
LDFSVKCASEPNDVTRVHFEPTIHRSQSTS